MEVSPLKIKEYLNSPEGSAALERMRKRRDENPQAAMSDIIKDDPQATLAWNLLKQSVNSTYYGTNIDIA